MMKSFNLLRSFGRSSGSPSLLKQIQAVADCQIAFHFSAAYIETPMHVNVWARHFNDSGVAWYVIARDAHHAATLRQAGLRVVYAPDTTQLRLSVGPKVKAIVYANNNHKNIEMLRAFPNLIHAQLLHGDSDKPTSFNPVTRNFDQIWVAGPLGQDRYAMNGVAVPEHAFVHVGRPQVVDRTTGSRIVGWQEKPTIAYMPTWFGFQGEMMLSSYDRAAQIIRTIRAVAGNAEILYKPHPLIDKHPEAKRYEREVNAALAETGAQMVAKESDAALVYERADVLVTDISSTMSDFLWSKRPLVVVAPRGYNDDMKSCFPSLGGSYLVDEHLQGLTDALQDSLTTDSFAQSREAMHRYSFGGLAPNEPADAAFFRAVRALVAQG